MQNEWNEERLQSLVRDKVPEDRFIDYKRDLPGDKEDEKREFLNDVTAFANTFGGTIIFGIEEEGGNATPNDLCGCTMPNPDESILRLENLVQSCVDPHLSSLRFVPIKLESGKSVLVLVIPQSPAAPHMVKKGSPKFYMRGSAGKQPMDVHDIRAAFLASETVIERIRNFRLDRIAKLASGGQPIPLHDNTAFIAHILPLASFTRRINLDLKRIQAEANEYLKPLMSRSGQGPEHCLEGLAQVAHDRDRKALSYTLLFRDGCIEAVDAYSMIEFQGKRFVREDHYGPELIQLLPRIFRLYEVFEIPFPCYLALSLVNVRGLCVSADRVLLLGSGLKLIDRDHLILPEKELLDRPKSIDALVRPVFDLVWNACGLPQSWNFDTEGNWKPRGSY